MIYSYICCSCKSLYFETARLDECLAHLERRFEADKGNYSNFQNKFKVHLRTLDSCRLVRTGGILKTTRLSFEKENGNWLITL